MKKIVMSLLLLISCAGYAAEQSVISLQQKGQAALKARNFAEVEKIIRDLRDQGSTRQAESLRTQLLKAKAGAVDADLFAQVAALQAEIDDLQMKLDQTIRGGDASEGHASEGQIADLRRQLQQALDRLAAESATAQQRIADLLAQAGVNQQVIDGLRNQLQTLQVQKTTCDAAKLLLEMKIAKLEKDISVLRAQVENKDAQGIIADLNKQLTDLQKKNDRLQEENNDLQIRLTNVGQELAQKNAEIDSLKNQLQAANALKAKAEKGAQQCEETRKKLDELLKAQTDQLKKRDEEITSLKQQLDQLKAGGGASGVDCLVLKQENIALKKSLAEYDKTNVPELKKEIERCGDVTLSLVTERDNLKKSIDDKDKEITALTELLDNANPNVNDIITKQREQINKLQNDIKGLNGTLENLTKLLNQK